MRNMTLNDGKLLLAASLLLTSIFAQTSCDTQHQNSTTAHEASRQTVDFNFDWKFSLSTENRPVENAQLSKYDDSNWRDVRLPHDWSIEAEYSQDQTGGATGYLPGGLGWYRKHFQTPDLKNAKTQILFDGIYNHSKVWLNGHLLGERPYGYSAFSYDLTPYLTHDGSDNILAVYVDRSRYVDSRWYTGSGIYRNVQLITTDKLHIPIWGTYVTTPEVTDSHATVNIEVSLQNDRPMSSNAKVHSKIFAPNGDLVAEKTQSFSLKANDKKLLNNELIIKEPLRWDLDSPNLYVAKTEIIEKGAVVDEYSTQFGVRTFDNDPENGFFLNGINVKIKGVNLHHDAGLVGAAVPKEVWRHRLQELKNAGVNTIRTAHNPASKEFLELTDEMGFLVQEEAFDEWDNPKNKRKNFNQEGEVDYITESYSIDFPNWAERDLKAMLKRDRNHASIFQWSIGNEIEWTYPTYPASTGYWDKTGDKVSYYWDTPPLTPKQSQQRFDETQRTGPKLEDTAKKLANWTREMDTTRPITANLVVPSVSSYSGFGDALDILGYSYRQSAYEYGHKYYPNKMIIGTENWVQWHEWQAVLDKPYVAGIMVWTGADYLGESNGRWPKKGSSSGMLDFASFKKPSYHTMKTVWSDEPHIYMTTQTMSKSNFKVENGEVVEKNSGHWQRGKWGWRELNEHWNYQASELISVEVTTNQPSVELFLNNTSLGIRHLKDNEDRILKWAVPFKAGKLRAVVIDDHAKLSTSLITAGTPVAVKLSANKTQLDADGYDVSRIVAQLVDDKGIPVRHIDQNIQFNTSYKLRALGVDNGWNSNIQKHQSDSIITHNGRALLLVQSTKQQGENKVSVTADKLTSDMIIIHTK